MMLAPLVNRDFRLLFISRSISLLGTGVATIALAFLAYHLAPQHAGFVMGMALVIKMVTYLVAGPVFGHYAPRLPRKLFLVLMDVLRCAFVIIIPFVTQIWQVYVLIFFISACSAGFTPLYQAVIPNLLPNENDYSQALVLTRIAYNIEMLLSPALSAALLLVFNFHSLFFLNAITFFLSALMLLCVHFPSLADNAKLKNLHLLSGIKMYLSNRVLLGCLILILLSSLAGATAIVNTVVFFHGVFAQSKSVTAMAMAFFGAGAILFALFMPKLRHRFKEQGLMIFGALVILMTYVASCFIKDWYWLFITWFCLGLGSIAIEGLLGVLVNQYTTNTTRTALFAANFSLTHGCWLIAYFLVGVSGQANDIRGYFLLLLILSIILFLLALFVWKPKRSARERQKII